MKINLIGINARFTHSCLALFYLRNELQSHCPDSEVRLEQYTINDPYHELVLNICAERTDYFFFSAAIWNSDLVTKLIQDLLGIDSHCFCVVGGPQASIVGDAVGDRRCITVAGQIERIGNGFYGDLRSGGLKQHYGCREESTGYSFPYMDSDYTSHLLNRHIYYESSRGCPFSCTYCLSAMNRGTYHKDVKVVLAELGQILKSNPKVVRFIDRTFNDNIDRALLIWRFLAEHDSDTVFHFEISPLNFTEEVFEFLQSLPVGKFQFEIGVQSTNEQTLQAIRRRIDIFSAGKIIQRLRKLGNIHLHVDLILGLPYETRETFLRSFQQVFAMEPHYVQMGLLKLLPNTPIFHAADAYGYTCSGSAPYSVYGNRWLGCAEMTELYWFSECVEKFYNNRYFYSFWEYLRRESVDVVNFFENVLKICRQNDFFFRAATHELMLSLILKNVEQWPNREYIVELLRYDWLRCGHRYLPVELDVEEEKSSGKLKKEVYAGQNNWHSSLEKPADIVRYLKKGYIAEFSRDFLQRNDFIRNGKRNILCFMAEKETGLYGFCKVAQFILEDREEC